MKALAEVARATSIPITSGERLTSRYDFARLLEHRAAAIFNCDVGLVGGILEARKIATMAESHYVQVAPHVYGGPMIAAASIQLSLSSQNFLIMEGIERFGGIYDDPGAICTIPHSANAATRIDRVRARVVMREHARARAGDGQRARELAEPRPIDVHAQAESVAPRPGFKSSGLRFRRAG
jgi:hypothetical protein